MTANNFPIAASQYRSFAARAVNNYIGKFFRGYFTEVEVEDIISDTVLRMWRARGRYDSSKGELTLWVWIIARNVVLNTAKAKAVRGGKRVEFEGDDLPSEKDYATLVGVAPSADRDVMGREFHQGLYDSLSTDREKRYLGGLILGLKASEMAEREDVSLNGAYTAVHTVRKRLQAAA